MNPPRIAIPVPTTSDLEYNARSWPQYALAVERSGGVAMKVPLDQRPGVTARLIADCSGVVLPGSGADVNPHKYGQEPAQECAPADPAREGVDELLLQDAHNMGKPILAICFGTQMLNVWRGGTLLQDLMCVPVNHKAGKSVAVAHGVAVAPDSLLERLLGQDDAPIRDGSMRLAVNSSHHQAIGIPGDGLRISARSVDDGVIEAVEGAQASDGNRNSLIIGVQWHPERSFDESATSKALFARLIEAAAAWMPRSASTSAA